MTEPLTLHIELPEGATHAVPHAYCDNDGRYAVEVQCGTHPARWVRVGDAAGYLDARRIARELSDRIAILAALTS